MERASEVGEQGWVTEYTYKIYTYYIYKYIYIGELLLQKPKSEGKGLFFF